MGMQGWLKGPIQILKIAITIPTKRMSRVITVHSGPHGRRARRPECKKKNQNLVYHMLLFGFTGYSALKC